MTKEERKEHFNRIVLKNFSPIAMATAVTVLILLGIIFVAIKLTGNDKIIRFGIASLFIIQLPKLVIVYRKSQKRELKRYSLKWIVINLLMTAFMAVLYSVFVVFKADV